MGEGRIGYNGMADRCVEFMSQHWTHYKHILPHQSPLTQAVLLNIHQRNQCASPTFVKTISIEQFHVPRLLMTCKKSIRRCSQCRAIVAAMEKIEPPIGNVKAFRIPKPQDDKMNKGYRVCYIRFQGSNICEGRQKLQ